VSTGWNTVVVYVPAANGPRQAPPCPFGQAARAGVGDGTGADGKTVVTGPTVRATESDGAGDAHPLRMRAKPKALSVFTRAPPYEGRIIVAARSEAAGAQSGKCKGSGADDSEPPIEQHPKGKRAALEHDASLSVRQCHARTAGRTTWPAQAGRERLPCLPGGWPGLARPGWP